MKRTVLASVISRELRSQRDRPAPAKTFEECFLCSREYLYRGHNGDDNGRFCSDRCRDAYDAGLPFDPDYASKKNPRWYSLPMGRHGFLINCAQCKRQFDSKGLRCCSTECERAYRQRQETAAVLREVGMDRAPKRKCAECGGDIPNWRNGRRVSKAVRFCSTRCRVRATRNVREAA